jgi:hypothetical protein
MIGLLEAPTASAHGGHGGHSGGGGMRAPRMSAPQRAYKMPRMSHSSTPAMRATTGSGARSNNTQAHAHSAQAHTNNTQAHAHNSQVLANNTHGHTNLAATATTGSVNPTGTAALNTTRTTPNGLSPYSYTYGSGRGARSYRAYGYGNGYRNRSYGGRYGYGRSQGYNRAIVARLRSVHASLARINHDYQGHRIRAMQAISMAIRQLSHRSMVYSGVGFASGMNNGRAMGMRQGGGAGAGAGRRQPTTQAQSDARMSQDLRNLQGINMQLASQGTGTAGHARASGHVQRAIQELHVALSIR